MIYTDIRKAFGTEKCVRCHIVIGNGKSQMKIGRVIRIYIKCIRDVVQINLPKLFFIGLILENIIMS